MLPTLPGYGPTPLPRKLGVKPGALVLLSAAPPDLDLGLGLDIEGLPDVTLHTRAAGSSYDVILAFCPDRARMVKRVPPLVDRITTDGALWVAWPKQASGVRTDLGDDVVRRFGLSTGLVDVKVVAVDETWSALKFVRRVRDR